MNFDEEENPQVLTSTIKQPTYTKVVNPTENPNPQNLSPEQLAKQIQQSVQGFMQNVKPEDLTNFKPLIQTTLTTKITKLINTLSTIFLLTLISLFIPGLLLAFGLFTFTTFLVIQFIAIIFIFFYGAYQLWNLAKNP